MANKKITDATTATSVAGTDKVFLNQGGDLKQVDLNSAVANSQAVQTLNSNLIRYKDYSVVFNENGDGGLTLPQDCHIIIACYILQGWKTISIFHYSQNYGFHSPELKSETCEVRLIYC